MGVIYKAQDLQLDRLVALKFLPPTTGNDPEAQQRFIHEARAASALDHPNICTIHEIGHTDEGQLFLCMALYDGETVRAKVERGPLKLEEAVEITVQVTQGLAKAHAQGMVHRDIKPANVMVTSDGIAKILDFGLAMLAGMTRLTKEGSTLGTAAYMSPEQARGDPVDARTDIWSLGVMLYEMVTGQLPFRGDYENAVVYAVMNTPAEPMTALRTGVPMELERIVSKAMAKDPAERYQHVDEMLVDLRRFRKESEPAHTPPLSAGETPPTKRPRWVGIGVTAAAVLAIAVAFLLLKPLLFDEALVSEPKPVAVITFTNQTGDRSYDYLQEAIPNLLITSLEQSRYLRVITWERMRDVLRQLGKGDVRVIDADLGFELCRREGIHAIVLGSYVKAGDAFATDAKVLDVQTKEILKSVSARGEGVQSILTSQIDELSKEIARGVGLSQRTIESSPSRIAEVTTSSMEAYTYFLRGRQEVEKLSYKEARESLQKAVVLDSTFAAAYGYLAVAHRYVIEIPASIEAIEKAKSLSLRSPEKERLLIEASYADYVEHDPAKECTLLEELVRKYPDEKRFHTYLGYSYYSLRRFSEAERELDRALELDPEFAPALNQLGYIYADQGHMKEAITALTRYAALSPGDANPFDSMGELYLRMGKLDEAVANYHEAVMTQSSFHAAYKSLAYVYALKEEYAACLRWIDSLCAAAPSPALKGEALAWKANYTALIGRERESQRIDGDIAEVVSALPGYEAPLHWLQAWAALRRRDLEASRKSFDLFHKGLVRTRPHTPVLNRAVLAICLGYVDLAAGRLDSVQIRVEEVKPRLDSLENFRSTLPIMAGILEAELLLARGIPDSAIRVYRHIPVPDPPLSPGWGMPFYNSPTLRDVVPRAFLARGELDSAISAYERLIRVDTTTRDRRLMDPRFHYRLALACERAGRSGQARAEYRRFLELWRDADEDRPELRDAKKRLVRLDGALSSPPQVVSTPGGIPRR